MSRKKAPSSSSTTNCYVVAYDIPNNRRRIRVHKILQGFGKWTQYSLFDCFLSGKELILLRSKLLPQLRESEDSVRFYPLCANCLDGVETIGGDPPAPDLLFVI